MYCRHCSERLSDNIKIHTCKKVGLLNVDEDDSFLVSSLIGIATNSALMGGLLGGDFVGGILGDTLDGDLFD